MKKFLKYLLIAHLILLGALYLSIDIEDAFGDPQSFVVFDQENNLLGAKIAGDEQWRFPLIDSLPENYKAALLCFEDKRYYQHPGVDLLSISRAVRSNIKAGQVVSGASTITMQLMRLSRDKNSRSVWQKIVETYLAVVYNLKYDKELVLRYYASHAPFGGNVVGVETAAWRYFGRSIHDLSWAEAATLAVLPNSPALIHPGKNRKALRQKRDRLLFHLHKAERIDELEYTLAVEEALPMAPKELPTLASHYVEEGFKKRKDNYKLVSSIDYKLQKNAVEILALHEGYNKTRGIENAGIMIRDTKTGEVLAYVGNNRGAVRSKYNNMVTTPRSTGSILKPLLYACSMNEGLLGPKQLISDVPIHLEGFQPKNYDKNYRGLVPAHEALSKSLNIPFVLMLKEYGVERFIQRLEEFGFSTINKSADHYGLSLILGGAEITLDELTSAYAKLGRIALEQDVQSESLHPSTVYHMVEAMTELQRPNEENFWESYGSGKKIAWKTGTSYGHRDAWAIGLTPEYTIGVWVGNSDGEARPEIIGSSLAGPILFDLIHSLSNITSFKEPLRNLQQFSICKRSGLKANKACIEKEETWLSPTLAQMGQCHYHQKVWMDKSKTFLVKIECADSMVDTSWFVVPPKEALHLKTFDPSYAPLPQLHESCNSERGEKYIDIVYPQSKSSFVIPKNLKEQKESIVCEVAHQFPNSKIYWHIDDEYIGMTEEFHKIPIEPGIGKHKLYVIDDQGRYDETEFEILK